MSERIKNMSWIRIVRVEDIPVREGRAVTLGDREIALFNLGDRFAAIDNRCPHNGGPLCDGFVSGSAVVCPLHGWRINLDDGMIQKPSLPVCVETYATRVENGIVAIQLPMAAGEEVAAA